MMDLASRAEYHLEPGYMYFSKGPALVRAVVGSCVAVCIWDKALHYGGVNHFLHPATKSPQEATPRFGNVATTALIRLMEEAGCRREDLVAQITGGGFPEGGSGNDIGGENVRVAREILHRKGIPIISEDVGGSMGRKIVFDTATGQLAVLKVHKIRSTDWIG
jgi:chemotaxis protein CheD